MIMKSTYLLGHLIIVLAVSAGCNQTSNSSIDIDALIHKTNLDAQNIKEESIRELSPYLEASIKRLENICSELGPDTIDDFNELCTDQIQSQKSNLVMFSSGNWKATNVSVEEFSNMVYGPYGF